MTTLTRLAELIDLAKDVVISPYVTPDHRVGIAITLPRSRATFGALGDADTDALTAAVEEGIARVKSFSAPFRGIAGVDFDPLGDICDTD